jgi:hypothetical protein
MYRLVRVHFSLNITLKIFIITHGLLLLLFMYLLRTPPLLQKQTIHMDYFTLLDNYIRQAFFLIKIFLVLIITMLSIYSFHINIYDNCFYSNHLRYFKASKLLTIIVYIEYLTFLITIGFFVILYLLGFDDFSYFNHIITMSFFVVFYSVLTYIVGLIKNHLMIYFFPFILYFISSIQLLENNVLETTKITIYQFLIYDVGFYNPFQNSLSITYYMSVLIIYICVVYYYKNYFLKQ